MLRPRVVEACERGDFAIYAADTVDQVMELLTGVKAGKRGIGGKFPAGSINARIEQRLREFSQNASGSKMSWL